MKRTALFIALLCFVQVSHAQKVHEIGLTPDNLELSDRTFYIESVIDSRAVKTTIGTVQKGLLNAKYPAQLKGGFTNTLQAYFDQSIPQEKDQIPITIQVKWFQVSELTQLTNEFAFADITLDYYHGKDLLFSNQQHAEVTGLDVTRLHEQNLRVVLKNSITAFNQSGWRSKMEGKSEAIAVAEVKTQEPLTVVSTLTNTTNPTYQSSSASPENLTRYGKRNTFTLGYQIGGYSLIGFDYEIRMHDYVGVHFGAGLSGYTYGVMFHTAPQRNSPYFNVSYKDGGFGGLTAAGIEYGGKWIFNKKTGFGLLFQIGIVKLIDVKSEFADILFTDGKVPPFMTSMGIGLSW